MADHEEHQYLNLIKQIMESGTVEQGRNGNTRSLFGAHMRFSLANNTIPLLTTKKVAFKTCFKELFFFIRGDTDNKILKEQKVHIWDANASQEFLQSRGIYNRQEDDLGPVYGYQWRYFNAPYGNCTTTVHKDKGVDQLQQIIDTLKNPETRTSRRMILTAWNPCQLDIMALPPCHLLAQFHVSNGNRLHCALYQRSGDVGLGVPFNIASYALLTHLIAHHCGLVAHEFVHFIGNAHIYEDHIEPLTQIQVHRTPHPFPKIQFTKDTPEKIEEYDMSYFEILDYEHHGPIKMKMSA